MYVRFEENEILLRCDTNKVQVHFTEHFISIINKFQRIGLSLLIKKPKILNRQRTE